MKKYDKYKTVNFDYIDKLPEDWKLLPNIAVFENRNQKGFVDEELLSVTIGRGVLKQSEIDKKDASNPDKSNYKLVEPNDIVYSMRFRQGASGFSNYRGIVSSACVVLKPIAEINPKYFHYQFRLSYYKDYAKRYSFGIADGQLPLRYNDFKRMYSIVPPLAIQNKIVAYLEKKEQLIDGLIQKEKRLAELLEEEYRTITYNLCTKGVINTNLRNNVVSVYGKVPENWEINKLKYVAYCLNNRRIPIETTERGRMKNCKYDYYGATGVIDKVNDYIFDETTILVAEDGANLVNRNLKLVYIASGRYWVNNHSHIIKPKKDMSIKYLTNLLEIYDYRPVITGSTQPKLTKDAFLSTIVLKPPIEEQQQIVSKINTEKAKVEKAQTQISKEIAALVAYKESLIHSAVLGKIKIN